MKQFELKQMLHVPQGRPGLLNIGYFRMLIFRIAIFMSNFILGDAVSIAMVGRLFICFGLPFHPVCIPGSRITL